MYFITTLVLTATVALVIQKSIAEYLLLEIEDEEEKVRSPPTVVRSQESNNFGSMMLMFTDDDWGSCKDCVDKNTEQLMECNLLFRRKEDFIKCFKNLAARDELEHKIHRKCNTCSCEQLRRMNNKILEDPEIHNLFCFTAKKGDTCGARKTDQSEHLPECSKDLTCKVQDIDLDYGLCKTEKCEDTAPDDAKDKVNMNCRNYELMNVCHKSDEYRDADFNGRKMCCHCGGGTTGRDMVRDVHQDNKKCGELGSDDRVFKLQGTGATKEICLEECTKTDKCIAMSGVWGSWCIGCQVKLDEPHNGAEAWKDW